MADLVAESYVVADCQFLDGSVSVELHPDDEVLGTYLDLQLALQAHPEAVPCCPFCDCRLMSGDPARDALCSLEHAHWCLKNQGGNALETCLELTCESEAWRDRVLEVCRVWRARTRGPR